MSVRHKEFILTMEGVNKRFEGFKAITDLNFYMDVGELRILIGPNGPIFLDAECAWWGDPAFDLAFCLNHLLLKCLWTPPARAGFLACFEALAARVRELHSYTTPCIIELPLGRIDPAEATVRPHALAWEQAPSATTSQTS